MSEFKIISTNIDNITQYGLCGYKNPEKPGYKEKLNWLQEQYKIGLKIKVLHSDEAGTQGMIEYLPGEYCWRPVAAQGFYFIHCLFVGFRKKYKDRGWGSKLIQSCIADAKQENLKGVAVVSRKGSFMAQKDIFLKHDFKLVAAAKPDFQLLVNKFNKNTNDPMFYDNWQEKLKKYSDGLYIIRADQCPYSVKNVSEILKLAKAKYQIEPQLIDLKNYKDAQKSPLPFGVFGIIYNGKVLAHHPISSRRFANIMESL